MNTLFYLTFFYLKKKIYIYLPVGYNYKNYGEDRTINNRYYFVHWRDSYELCN